MNSDILIVDDNSDVLFALKLLLKGEGYRVETLEEPGELKSLLRRRSFSLIFLDMNFSSGVISGDEGLHWLETILNIDPSVKVVLMTAYGQIDLAVKGMKIGASDFVEKPWDNSKILAIAKLLTTLRSEEDKNSSLIENSLGSTPIIGETPEIKELLSIVERVAKTEANILITGENGTGKELVAREIYRLSNRSGEPYITLDMGAIPEKLFESELFGYVKGAFTGAEKDRKGKIVSADSGSLFLDEIANIPLEIQSKLLRVLESRELTPLGSDRVKPFDIRLICGTNLNLKGEVIEGRFREDLLYRINTVEIKVPPLRDRKGDIPILFDHFLDIYKKKYKRENLKVTGEVYSSLVEYHWPGNVRELKHLVERVVILSASDSVKVSDLNLSIEKRATKDDFSLESAEVKAISDALEASKGNLTKASSLLGITRATLYRKMEKYGI